MDASDIIIENEPKKKGKKEKKGKKYLKKQKREEEERKKEEELKKENNEEEDNDKIDENKKEDENKNEEIKEEEKEEVKDNKEDEDKKEEEEEKDNEKNNQKEEEEEIDTSSKNNNNESEEIATNSITEDTKEEDRKEEENENIINEEEPNEEKEDGDINKIFKKLKKARKGSICQELTLREGECDYVINKAYDILKDEDSMLKISAPLYICGDIHGQYYDLLRVFEILDYPPKSTFLFLGDYVDRGKQSLECLLLLLCLKIKYPSKIFLLRGNHESEALNKIYGFYDECKRRVSVKCFKKITTLFNVLPITALIDENILCMHGGLSKELNNIEQ